MPIKARIPTGSAVIQNSIIFIVIENVDLKMGMVIPIVSMAASIAFLSFTIPPKSEPVSIKFGGIIYVSLFSFDSDNTITSWL